MAALELTGKMVELLLVLDLKVMAVELALLVTVILGWVSSFPLVAPFHAVSPPFLLLLPLVVATLPVVVTLISNLGTALRPASCTSGSTS